MRIKAHLSLLYKSISSSVRIFFAALRLELRFWPQISWIYCHIGSLSSESRWQQQLIKRKRLSVCAVSYRQVDPLLSFLYCFACQSLQCFEVLIMHDGYHHQTCQAITGFQVNANFPLEIFLSSTRYNDWGHSLRAKSLDIVDSEFILITNADNYYSPRMVEYAFAAIDKYSLDLVYWDMIHSHSFPGGRNLNDYSFFKTLPIRRSIDIGCFIVRTSIAQKAGFISRTLDADGMYFDDLLSTGLVRRIGYIDRVLFVHN